MGEVVVRLPELHPGQVRRRREVAGKRFVVTMCGRRWGKSLDAVEWLGDGTLSGMRCGLFAPNYKYLLELWKDLAHRLRPVAELGGRISEQEKTIELPNGGRLDCWSLDDPDAGRGRKYHRIAVDEAGVVRGLLDIWQMSLRPTLVDERGSAWFYGTPKGRTHDFSVLFAKGEGGDAEWASFRAPTADNPYIPADEIAAARRELPGPVFAQEFEGIPADDGANPFGADAIRRCVGPMSAKAPVAWGWDFARAQDWTVGIGLDEDGAVCRFERWQLRPWVETTQDVIRLTGQVPAWGDSTGVGDPVVEFVQRARVPMTGVHFSRPEKQILMEGLRAAIQRGTIRFPDGPIVRELDAFQYTYTASGVRYEAPRGVHDDCVMALALAVKGMRPKIVAKAVPDIKQPHQAAPLRIEDGKLVTPDRPPTNVAGWLEWHQDRRHRDRLPPRERDRLPRRKYR